jgi:hypothetical protein
MKTITIRDPQTTATWTYTLITSEALRLAARMSAAGFVVEVQS